MKKTIILVILLLTLTSCSKDTQPYLYFDERTELTYEYLVTPRYPMFGVQYKNNRGDVYLHKVIKNEMGTVITFDEIKDNVGTYTVEFNLYENNKEDGNLGDKIDGKMLTIHVEDTKLPVLIDYSSTSDYEFVFSEDFSFDFYKDIVAYDNTTQSALETVCSLNGSECLDSNFKIGDNVLKYITSDINGNSSSLYKQVKIVEITPPSIELEERCIFLDEGKVNLDECVSVTDDSNDLINVEFYINDLLVDDDFIFEVNSYDILVKATDLSANESIANFELVIIPNVPTFDISIDGIDISSVSFTLTEFDENQVGEFTSIKIYSNEQLIEEITELSTLSFDSLESNVEYKIEASYTYSLNGGISLIRNTKIITIRTD